MSQFPSFSSSTVTSDSFRLDFSETFPANRFHKDKKKYWRDRRFVALPPPTAAAHLELELGKELGAGGTGVVHTARVANQNSNATIPSQVVVKFARLNHCRNLAREAWIYERMATLTELNGTAVPHSLRPNYPNVIGPLPMTTTSPAMTI